MNERERHEAFTREMDRLEREFGGGPPRAHAPPPRNTAPMRSNHRQSLAERQREAYDRAAREYSPLPDELGPIVPMTAALADIPASMIDAGLARFGDRDAAVRRDARTRRWQRGTDEVARDVVSDDHAGAALIDSVKAIPGAIRQAVEAERAASDRHTIGGGRAGRPSPIPVQHTPLDYVGPVARMLWMGWPEAGRDARGRVAASDVLTQEAEQSGDRLGAKMERRRGDDAAGDDFAITAPGALEPAFIATGQSLINAPLSLGRATTRGALRLGRASIPRFLEAPVREAIGPLTQEGRRVVQAGATISAATAGGAALADAHSDAPAAPVAGAVLGALGSRRLMRPGGAGGLERGGAIEGAAHAVQDAAPRGTLRDVQPDAITARPPLRGARATSTERRVDRFWDDRLSAQENKAVEMARNNFSNSEIADELDVSVAHVKVVLKNARKRGVDVPYADISSSLRGRYRGQPTATIEEIVALYRKLRADGAARGGGPNNPGIRSQIAERLGIPAGSVGSRLNRFLKNGGALAGALGATGAYLLGADQADAGDGARGDSTDWLGMAGAGAAGAGALYSLVRGGRFLGDALAERAARRRILGAASEPEFRRELAAQSGRGEGEIRQGLANARAGRDPTAPVDRTELPPLPANQRRRLQRATDFHELASAFARTRRLAGETLARLAESMGVAVVRKGARLDRQATAANIILAATETTNAGRPTANALARRARLREMGLFANVEVGAADLPSRPGAPRAPGEIRANASPPPGPRRAGTAADMQPDAISIFAGRNARTADREALARAEAMDTQGVSRDDIWRETGWFKGVDGQWRWEIDDSGARLGDEAVDRFFRGGDGVGVPFAGNARSILEHPELYEAYPELGGRMSQIQRGDDPFLTRGDYDGLSGRIRVTAPDTATARSALLHEKQHGVQRQEGFPVGGSPENSWGITEQEALTSVRAQKAEALGGRDPYRIQNNISAGYPIPADDMAALQRWRELTRQEDELLARLIPGAEGYRRLAGETEARNVQARRAFTPAERRARPPWQTQDTPDDQQIIRYGLAGLGVTGAGAAALGADDAQANNGEATPSAGLSPEALATILGGVGLGAVAAGRLRSGHTGPTLRDMARYPNGIIDTAARGGIRSDIDPRLIMGAGAIASAPVAMAGADALSDQLGENANIGQAEARTGALRGAVRRMNDAPPDAPWNYTQDAPSLLPEPTPEERRKAIERILSNARGITLADITEDDIRREADIIRRARMGMVTGRGEPGDAAQSDIDTSRPAIENADGSYSTERTITIEADGRFVVLPTIVNGRQLSEDDAIAAWQRGENREVGVFSSQEEADTYARNRSERIPEARRMAGARRF